MESILENNKVGPPSGMPCNLHSAFDGICAAIVKEHTVETAGQNLVQFFGQSKQGGMIHQVLLRMEKARGLVLYGGNYFRMTVSRIGNPITGGKIENFLMVCGVEIASFGMIDYNVSDTG